MTVQRTHAALFPPGTLVRVDDELSAFWQMTATVVGQDGFVPTVVSIRMTSTGHVLSFSVGDLAPVERGE